ncbi:hypothetical protein BJ742DRAFT_828862 [Cladochytrium replicatum]|nr:hypothetical protein BJ742DRAFT_828862 [Cladochytrium replicatum]
MSQPATFDRLFRASNFCALHKDQVVRTSWKGRLTGEWGLKRSLPRDLRTTLVKVTRHEHGPSLTTKFVSGSTDVGIAERWRELFAEAYPTKAISGNTPSHSNQYDRSVPTLNLATMSDAEFAELKRKAALTRTVVKASDTGAEMIQKVLGVRVEKYAPTIHPPTYLHHKSNDKLEQPKPESKPGTFTPQFQKKKSSSAELKVKGRMLNPLRPGSTAGDPTIVGIGGFSASLKALRPESFTRKASVDYMVSHVGFDGDAQPLVEVGLYQPDKFSDELMQKMDGFLKRSGSGGAKNGPARVDADGRRTSGKTETFWPGSLDNKGGDLWTNLDKIVSDASSPKEKQ